MKCPSCGYNSFGHLEYCKKCGSPLKAGYETRGEKGDAGDSAKNSYRPLPKNDRDDSLTGDLFLDIPIREETASPPAKSPKSGVSRRKRERAVGKDSSSESPELFRVSKEFEREASAGDNTGVSNADERSNASPMEEDLSDPRPDPFLLEERGDPVYDQFSEKKKGRYEQEPDVYNLAGITARALAFIVDIMIVSLIAFLAAVSGLYLVYGLNFGAYDSENVLVPLYLVLFILASTYFVFLHGYGGKTVGKMLLGIKLINSEGEGVGLWEAFVRWVGYYISAAFLFAGYLWSLIDAECQTWHDKIAGTYVVKD
jgi:uncharacterized RDD family membrane protein YckC